MHDHRIPCCRLPKTLGSLPAFLTPAILVITPLLDMWSPSLSLVSKALIGSVSSKLGAITANTYNVTEVLTVMKYGIPTCTCAVDETICMRERELDGVPSKCASRPWNFMQTTSHVPIRPVYRSSSAQPYWCCIKAFCKMAVLLLVLSPTLKSPWEATSPESVPHGSFSFALVAGIGVPFACKFTHIHAPSFSAVFLGLGLGVWKAPPGQ